MSLSAARRLIPSRTRRQRRVSLWVLVWLCLIQFPVPVLHAHQSDAEDDACLAAHLQAKHGSQRAECENLHWHLAMPWELANDPQGGESEEGSQPGHPSPLGLWGAQGDALFQLEAFDDAPLSLLGQFVIERIDPNRPLPHCAFPDSAGPPANFMRTYDGVPPCALLGVCLR